MSAAVSIGTKNDTRRVSDRVMTPLCWAASRRLHWQAQFQPHAPFDTPRHVIPGGQVPTLQALQPGPATALSLLSPHGIDSPVQAHVCAPVCVQVVPDGQPNPGGVPD
jgi:hypothetical protein